MKHKESMSFGMVVCLVVGAIAVVFIKENQMTVRQEKQEVRDAAGPPLLTINPPIWASGRYKVTPNVGKRGTRGNPFRLKYVYSCTVKDWKTNEIYSAVYPYKNKPVSGIMPDGLELYVYADFCEIKDKDGKFCRYYGSHSDLYINNQPVCHRFAKNEN